MSRPEEIGIDIPSTEFEDSFSKEVWETTYKSHNDNTIDDTMRRVARFVASAEESDRQKEVWEARFYDMLSNFKCTAGGRIYANAGTEWGGTTLMNCISGDTRVITSSGVFRADEIPPGSHIEVLTENGQYESAIWNDYGIQPLYEITLANGEVVVATRGHEWVVTKPQGGTERVTTERLVGRNIPLNGINNYKYQSDEEYLRGIQNGLVFGDGYTYTDFTNGPRYSALQQFGDSRHLVLDFFGRVNTTWYKGDPEGIHYVNGMEPELKDIPPITSSVDYLRGFIAGVVAADGHVDARGSVMLHTSNYEYACQIRDIAVRAGLPIVSLRIERKGSAYSKFATENSKLWKLTFVKRFFQQDPRMILKNSHKVNMTDSPDMGNRRTTVKCVSVEFHGRNERVYCCEQPTTHTFTIANGLLTGNCFVSPRENYDIDSLPAIIHDVLNQAQTLKSEGGWGQNFSWLRPRGAFINGIGVETPGAVKYMEIYDKVSDVITSGSGRKSANKKAKGKIRKGAMMGVLDVWHPDVEEFIRAKQQPGRLTKFNVSVNCTDEFMNKVNKVQELEKNGASKEEIEEVDQWDLRFPDTSHEKYEEDWNGNLGQWEARGYPTITYKTVSATNLWNLIMESTYSRAEPGVLFLDRANHFGPLNYFETIAATNPCGEQTLAPGGVCNLGSINLTQFVLPDGTGFDLEKIALYTRYLNRFLDNINSLSNAPLQEYVDSMRNKRRVGIGILGWGSALFMMKVRFGSEKATDLRDQVMQTIAREAYKSSIDLAEEKGMFKYCQPEKHADGAFVRGLSLPKEYIEKMKRVGIRNSSLLSVQPTGNTSILANVVSGGLEPIFMPEYVRTVIVNTMPEEIADVCPKWYEGEWHETEMFKFDKEGDEEILRGKYNGTVFKIDKNRGLTKEVLCQDYGVRWLESRGEWDPEAEWAVTTTNLLVQDHVDDLKGFARWVDSAMSKCVVEGTLISTDRGILPIEKIGYAQLEDTFTETRAEYKVIDENGDYKRITSHYCGGERPCAEVKFSNGQEIKSTYEHKFKTVNGWKSVADLEVGDKVFYRTNPTETKNIKPIKVSQPVFAPNATNIQFPTHFDEDFALYVGMWLADGCVTNNSISICQKNDAVGDTIRALQHSLFGTNNESVDPRNGVVTHYHHSCGVSKWMVDNFGSGAQHKKIPEWVLLSPKSVLSALLSGLTLDGYIDPTTQNLVIYEGYSKQIATSVSTILSVFGIEYHILEKNKAYRIVGYMNDFDTIIPVEPHKQVYNITGKQQGQTYCSDEQFEDLIENQPHSVVGSQNRDRLRKDQARGNFIRMSFLERLGVDSDPQLTCVTVTNIKDIGLQPVYDIEVEDTHSYTIGGIVTHNTVNVPHDYPFEEFKNIYLESYRSGYVKGVTTYRAGTMTTVLSAKEERDADLADEEIILDDVKLPNQGPASYNVIRAEGKKWYLTTIMDEQGKRPVAFFVHTNAHEKSVTTHDAVEHLLGLAREKKIPEHWVTDTEEKIKSDNNATKIARCISLNLRHGVLIKNVVSALENVENMFVGSFLFQIKKYLMTWIKDGEKVSNGECPECGAHDSFVYSEGCIKCSQCGYSKCG